jgi:hypothetical protein
MPPLDAFSKCGEIQNNIASASSLELRPGLGRKTAESVKRKGAIIDVNVESMVWKVS